jgi:hypothetical protein
MSHHRAIFEAVANNVRPLTKRDALWLSDQIVDMAIDMVIDRLRSADVTPRSFQEWSVMLADLRQEIGELLARQIQGRVNLVQVLNTIKATY